MTENKKETVAKPQSDRDGDVNPRKGAMREQSDEPSFALILLFCGEILSFQRRW